LIYEQLTPFTDSPRGKASIFVWWSTVLVSFILLAEALNRPGLFGSHWCLVAFIIGVGVLFCCYGSWLPNGRPCNGDKVKGAFAICAFFSFYFWMGAFFYFKSEFTADFSWYVGFAPWWIFGIISFFALGASWIAFIINRNSSDFWIIASLVGSATVAFFTIGAFLVLLAYNLDKNEVDAAPYSWTIVITPMIVFEAFSFCACSILTIVVYLK